MSAVFWFVAGVTAGIVATIVAIPLWRVMRGAPRRPLHYAAVGCGIAAFVAAAALIYRTLGHPASLDPTALTELPAHPDSVAGSPAGGAPTGKAQSMESAAAGLEARLARGGGSAADWNLLAQSYEFLGRAADAQRAREHVSAAGGQTASVTSAAGGPALPKTNIALVWEAAASAQVAPTPEADADIEEATRLSAAPLSQPPSDTVAAESVEIDGTVTIEPRLVGRVDRDATLFIYAKAVDAPGPPLAVMRTTASAWPVTFRLDDSMAMVPSRKLSQFDKVVIEARISRTGQAAPAPGDLYVTSDVLRPKAGKKLALVINHEIG
jgi:cytochrome c-type biogenesis protein CcmH